MILSRRNLAVGAAGAAAAAVLAVPLGLTSGNGSVDVFVGSTPTAVAGACDRNATSAATLTTQVGLATTGQTICLATADYGTWTGAGNKAITVKAGAGQSPSMKFDFASDDVGFTVDGMVNAGSPTADLNKGIINSSNITIKNSTFTSMIQITATGASGIVLDNNDHMWAATYPTASASNAKLRIDNATGANTGVTVENSDIGNTDLDGIHLGGGADILNNTFENICEQSYHFPPAGSVQDPQHTDQIQYEGGTGGRIAGNLILVRNNYVGGGAAFSGPCFASQMLTTFDGVVDGVTIEDNVLDGPRSWGIEYDGAQNIIIRHNTLIYRPPYAGDPPNANECSSDSGDCGRVFLGFGHAVQATHDVDVYSNVMGGNWADDGATSSTLAVFGNMCRSACTQGAASPTTANIVGSPTFAGGSNPYVFTTYSQYCLATGSTGKGAGVNASGTSDGTDMGIRC